MLQQLNIKKKESNNMKLILASKSPRRREILGAMGYTFDIVTADCDENVGEGIRPREAVELLARRKGEAVALANGYDADPEVVVLSSDTLVDLDDVALGKPVDGEDAMAMLRALSAKVHYVHTGVALRCGGRVVSGVATTAVVFRALTEEEMRAYVNSGEPMDKAGAYGIQGGAGKFVEKIEGDFDTVVGLSSALVKELMMKISEV